MDRFQSAAWGVGEMLCPSCKTENPQDMNFCGKCGTRLVNRCPKCGFESPTAFDFCGRCGSPLSDYGSMSHHERPVRAAAPTQAVLSSIESQEVPDGERKMVTALFADIKGSMELMEDLDPEE